MEYTLTVPDQKQEFIQELLQAFSYVKLTPKTKQPRKKLDETEYLLSTKANREQLLAAIERLESGKFEVHNLIEE